MNYTQSVKTVRDAYSDLAMLDLQDGYKEVECYLLEMNEKSERGHRRFKPDSLPRSRMSIQDAAKLFVCQHLLDGFAEPDKWSIDDITSIRTEVLYAQTYAKRFHKELEQWAAKYADAFKQIDYAELMKVAA